MATETWVLNETLTISGSNVYNNIEMTYSGQQRAYPIKSLKIYEYIDGRETAYSVLGQEQSVYSDENTSYELYGTGGGASGWFSYNGTLYNTWKFSQPVTDSTLLTWLQANGTKQSTSQVSIDLTSLSGYESLAAGTYALAVRAKAQGYQDSDLSSTVSFTKLAAPVITASDTSVNWEAVANAESYDVYVDGELYENTTGGASFVQIPITKDTANGYSVLQNMDKTKIYTIRYCYNTSTNAFAIFSISWNGSSWVASGDTLIFYSNTETSISFRQNHDNAGSTIAWLLAACLEGSSEATVEDFEAIVTNYDNVFAHGYCLIEGTLITLADGTTKPIEDIIYDDDILVWNFYEGKFDSSKPCWIMKPQIAEEYNLCKFSNGAEVGFVGQGGDIGYHRIYNDEAKCFTHTGVAETPVGTHTFAEDESFPELVSQEVIKKPVRFYNVGTTKHINLFANGILTSSRISNKYAIEDMKYVGERLISEEDEQKYIEKALVRC